MGGCNVAMVTPVFSNCVWVLVIRDWVLSGGWDKGGVSPALAWLLH